MRAAVDAYEDGGIRGLCAEGRWELAVEAMRRIDPSEHAHRALPVRRLGPGDAARWLELRLRALREEPRSFLRSEEEDARRGVDVVAERLAQPSDEAFVLGAEIGGVLAGTVGVVRADASKARHRAILWGFYVAPEHRRAGLGRALLRGAIRQARAMPGVELLALSVDTRNDAAKALYRAEGFITWGVEPDGFRAAGERVDEEHMLLRLE